MGSAKILERIIEWIGGSVLAVVTLITILQVFFRYVLKMPLIWSEELSRFLFIWTVWFGAILGIAQGKHFAIQFIRDRFPSPWPQRVKIITDLLALAFLAVLAISGVSLVKITSQEFYVTFPVSVKYAYMASVVGGVLMFFFLTLDLRSTFRSLSRKEKKS